MRNNNQKTNNTIGGEDKELSGQAELMFWDTIKNSSNPADFKAYLEQFPQGKFAGLARIRSKAADISEVGKPAATKGSERKKADTSPLDNRAIEAARKKDKAARIAREQEEVRKKAEAARIAREQEEEGKKKKKRRIISTF